MFKPGSLQRDYTLCSQYDGALDLPAFPDELPPDADADAKAQRDKIIKERAEKLKAARDHNSWPTLVKPGSVATIFHFRHIPGSDVDWWHGQNEKLGGVEGQALLFRLALKSVENLGALEIKHEEIDGHRLVSSATLDALYAIDDNSGIGRKVVGELAGIVAEKTFARLTPKS